MLNFEERELSFNFFEGGAKLCNFESAGGGPEAGRLFYSTQNEQPQSPTYAQNRKLTVALVRLGGLLMWFAVCFLGLPAQAKYGGGSGTAEDPYLIYSAEQMNAIGANPTDWEKHFKLMDDIDLSAFSGSAFNIIGQWVAWGSPNNKPFSGIFDGNGKIISNFSCTFADRNGIGLFGCVRGRIKDLGLVVPNIVAKDWYIGSLVGYLDQGTISGCYAKGASVSGGGSVGGLVGAGNGTVARCYSTGQIWGDTQVGGLVGLVGPGLVANCYAKASVSGNQDVGGLVGKTDHPTSTITDCYATGSVSGSSYVGGLVGQIERGAIAKCYSTGSVSGYQNVGGLIGYVRLQAPVWNCFWDIQTSGQLTSADGTGKTTAQMQTLSTFSSAGWDFFSTWGICEGTNYPVLLWQIPTADFRCPDGVNMIDFAWFAQHWMQKNCNPSNYYCDGIDLDRSGSVGFFDLAIFANDWLAGF